MEYRLLPRFLLAVVREKYLLALASALGGNSFVLNYLGQDFSLIGISENS